MGIGLLSMPYAMRLGGWLAIGALLLATTTFCYSGRLLVKAFDKLPAGTLHTYPALGGLPIRLRRCSTPFSMPGEINVRDMSEILPTPHGYIDCFSLCFGIPSWAASIIGRPVGMVAVLSKMCNPSAVLASRNQEQASLYPLALEQVKVRGQGKRRKGVDV
jgi:hypothetical protein